MITKRSKGLMR